MKHVSTSTLNRFSRYARRGALLLGLGAAGPAAWGQSFGPASHYVTDLNGRPFSLALGDVNGDGWTDIVVANFNTSTVGVLLAQVSGGFAPAANYGVGGNPYYVTIGDLNGDNRLDIVTANFRDHVGVLLGSTSGFSPVVTYTTGTNTYPTCVALGDTNGDGRLDILTTNQDAGTIGVLRAVTGGGFSPMAAYSIGPGTLPRDMALGDVNGDGRLDVVTTNRGTDNVGVLIGLAGSGFAQVSTYNIGIGRGPRGLALGDVDGDGRPDIITANETSGSLGVLRGQASGFAPVAIYPTRGNSTMPRSVALGDINGNGWLDVIVSTPGTDVLQVFVDGNFSFSTSLAMGVSSVPEGVALADMNGDRRLDIVAANYGYGTAGVFLNTGTFTPLAARPAAAADIALAPNPAHEAFTVTLPAGTAATEAELRNALGQVVRRPAGAGPRFTVETAGLAPGVYSLRLRTGAAVVTKRVVVQ